MYLKIKFKESDNGTDAKSSDGDLTVTVLNGDLGNSSDKLDYEVWKSEVMNLDLSHSSVACVIAGSTLPTGAHVLKSQSIWIADIGATGHVIKHMGGRKNHSQTNDWTRSV
jgi:hypothetical protein